MDPLFVVVAVVGVVDDRVAVDFVAADAGVEVVEAAVVDAVAETFTRQVVDGTIPMKVVPPATVEKKAVTTAEDTTKVLKLPRCTRLPLSMPITVDTVVVVSEEEAEDVVVPFRGELMSRISLLPRPGCVRKMAKEETVAADSHLRPPRMAGKLEGK